MGIESEGGAGGGGFGGAADLLGGAAPAAGDSGGGGGAGEGGGEGGGGTGGGDAGLGADPDWWGTLSAEAEGEAAANRDYVKSKGWKSPDDAIKSYREAERALRDGGRIKVPGEGASAEEVSAFNKAIGVPENIEGYVLPDVKDADGNSIPLDDSLLGKLLPKALERGVPAAAMNGLVADFVQLQLDDVAQFDADAKKAAQAWVTAQGQQSTEKLAAIDAAGRALGFTSQDMVAIRNALAASNGPEAGVAKALDAFTKLGQGMAEDTIITGGRGRFGVTGREAQGELDAMKAQAGTDKAYGQKVQTPGTPENARWNRLQESAAEWQRQQDRAA
ncbi:hypothetical protein [Novosphingobium sp. BL-52-GroH]|uniref:hypothetical protein n=1 Tax=Novosphingobium sp. BL-52-GroH TaxID=3349877 RepID=UPI0038509707